MRSRGIADDNQHGDNQESQAAPEEAAWTWVKAVCNFVAG